MLETASRGFRFQMVVNQHSPVAEELQALFDPIEGAEVIRSRDNTISMQGLSDREVVFPFPGVESYTAVLIRDKYFVRIVKSWFDQCVYKRCQANDWILSIHLPRIGHLFEADFSSHRINK